MRRQDRAVTAQKEILDILDDCKVIRIGLCAENKPYIVPMNFAYQVDGEQIYIYLHCASEGKKLDMIAQNNNICFEADCSCKIIEGADACSWTAKYQSVMGEGQIAIISEQSEKNSALDLLMERYGFSGKPSYNSNALSSVTALKIAVKTITGKTNIV